MEDLTRVGGRLKLLLDICFHIEGGNMGEEQIPVSRPVREGVVEGRS
jgi:hypothetical protein